MSAPYKHPTETPPASPREGFRHPAKDQQGTFVEYPFAHFRFFFDEHNSPRLQEAAPQHDVEGLLLRCLRLPVRAANDRHRVARDLPAFGLVSHPLLACRAVHAALHWHQEVGREVILRGVLPVLPVV